MSISSSPLGTTYNLDGTLRSSSHSRLPSGLTNQIHEEEHQPREAPYNLAGFAEISGSEDHLDESCDADSLQESADPHRGVKRILNRWQIFFIVISGTIGLGLFSDTGKILSLAGPGGGLLAFAVVGIVVVLVMECITEMITYWPISNALVEFVSTFVDKDLGIIVGFAYWYSYSITFATLISAVTDLAAYYSLTPALHFSLFNVMLPFILLAINYMGVKWYGNVEAVLGASKLLLVGGACILMLVVNLGVVDDGFCHDPAVAANPALAMLVAVPMTVYAFCGVEIVAVTALEATKPTTSLRWAPTRFIAPILLVGYLISVFMFYLNVSWKDSLLVSLPRRDSTPSSVIMIVAMNAKIPRLPGFLNGCMIMALLSAANTTLYVASRTLYGLTRRVRNNGTWHNKWLCKLGTTNERGVPAWALLASALMFGGWLPAFHFWSGFKDQALQEIMSGVATVAIILVWASQCIAFIRFRKWLSMHEAFVRRNLQHFEKSLPYSDDSLPGYWAMLQPAGAWIGLVFCLLTVAVFSSASWSDRGESTTNILAAWIVPILLVLIWTVTKIWTQRGIVELSMDNKELRDELNRLDAIVTSRPGGSRCNSKESSRSNTLERAIQLE